MTVIETERLILRTWKEEDVEPYYEMNQDPQFLTFLLDRVSSLEEVRGYVEKTNNRIKQQGYSFFAVEEKQSGVLIGSLGLESIEASFPFAPAVEAGWRLASHYCGQGYATEAAQAVLQYGFDNLGLEEIVSYAVASNQGSRRVMEKTGMRYDPEADFAHPELPKEHLYSKHVLYRIKKSEVNKLQKLSSRSIACSL